MLKCKDRQRGFVRSVTPIDLSSVPEVRQCLNDLQERAPSLCFTDVIQELKSLRAKFVERRRGKGAPEAVEPQQFAPISKAAMEAFRALERTQEATDFTTDHVQELAVATTAAAVSQQDSAAQRNRGGRRKSRRVDEESSVLHEDHLQKAVMEEPAAGHPHLKADKIARRLASADRARELKEEGRGLFEIRKASPQLAALLQVDRISRTEALRAVWKYIKDHGLKRGRLVSPDARLRQVCPEAVFDCFRLNGMITKHLL